MTASLDGRWYITETAAGEYVTLMRPRVIDLDEATDELIELSERAHRVRVQDNGLELWRVKASNGRRIRLLVGQPPPAFRQRPGVKLALVHVLGEHGGVR